MLPHLLSAITWRPGISDPDVLSWATVGAYLLASVLCFRMALVGRRLEVDLPQFTQTWLWLGVAMAVLGVNKQLDLHVLIVQILREIAYAEGWYGKRRAVQGLFLVVLGVIAVTVLWRTAANRWRFWTRHVLAAVGVLFLTGYILARAAAFNHLDEMIGSRWRSENWLGALEMAGACAIAASAAKALMKNE